MKRQIIGVTILALVLAAFVGTKVAAQGAPGGDPFTIISAKLDALLAAISSSSVDLRGVAQNWDKALPADDPGGPCPNNSSRFTCVMDGAAVRDNETGLVWEQAPQTYTYSWDSARFICANRSTGNRHGWRLPAVHELASLIDSTHTNPSLPPGHPFTNVVSGLNGYWTESTDTQGVNVAWALNFYDGFVGLGDKTYGSHAWCVRGGGNADRY